MTGSHHIDGIEVTRLDRSIGVRIDEVQARGGAPVAQQARLDMVRPEWLTQEWVVEQVDLPDGEVVRRSPVGIDSLELRVREGFGFENGWGLAC